MQTNFHGIRKLRALIRTLGACSKRVRNSLRWHSDYSHPELPVATTTLPPDKLHHHFMTVHVQGTDADSSCKRNTRALQINAALLKWTPIPCCVTVLPLRCCSSLYHGPSSLYHRYCSSPSPRRHEVQTASHHEACPLQRWMHF